MMTVAEVPCSLSVWNWEDPVPRTWCSALGLIDITTWQPILVQKSRETCGLPRTPSCFSALLKYTLQKINWATAGWHNPKFMLLFTIQAPKTRVRAPAAAGLRQWGNSIFNILRKLQTDFLQPVFTPREGVGGEGRNDPNIVCTYELKKNLCFAHLCQQFLFSWWKPFLLVWHVISVLFWFSFLLWLRMYNIPSHIYLK
jgi:hypothetical protein